MSEDRNAFRRKTAFVTGGGTGIGRATNGTGVCARDRLK
jgi:hypothetical protein